MREDESSDTGKYEALCHVARGVIHDLNNALMVASGYIELAKLRGVKDAEMHAMLCEALKACQSGINSTRRLLGGSAGGCSAVLTSPPRPGTPFALPHYEVEVAK